MTQRGWPFGDGSRWSLILLDLRFVYGQLNVFGDPQDGSLFGIDILLPLLRDHFGEDLPIVVLSSTSKDENNAKVRRLGALDFIQRIPGAGDPPEQARSTLSRVLFNHGLIPDYSGMIVGRSISVLKMLRQSRRAANSARNILLNGETGTGKGLLAHYIHNISNRKEKPFEVYNAANQSAELQSDALFGHWKGAFTGAERESPGIWERANEGTLFIDEVADIDLSVQQKLMQPIEERTVSRLGHPPVSSKKVIPVDVLAILATNRNLDELSSEGKIKSDFLNRINAFVVEVAPLHQRMEDIEVLSKHLLTAIAPEWQGKILPDALKILHTHKWQEGNIRELRNVLERAVINNPEQDITAKDILIAEADLPKQLPSKSSFHQEERWEEFIKAIRKDPKKLTVADVESLKQHLKGDFIHLIVRILEWSFELYTINGKVNSTAAAAFLLGKDKMKTTPAKQFLKKVITLDTKNGEIAKELKNHPVVVNDEKLSNLIDFLLGKLNNN